MSNRHDVLFGLAVVAAALLIVFVWVPLDTDSGVIEVRRQRILIGDALAPVVAGMLLGLGGLLLIVERRLRGDGVPAGLTLRNIAYLAGCLVLVGLAFAVMRWTGPLAAALWSGEGAGYRVLRDTAPWKFLGFIAGGAGLVGSMISLAERQVSPRAFGIGLVAAVVLTAAYDLPFEDLLLPPNGDV